MDFFFFRAFVTYSIEVIPYNWRQIGNSHCVAARRASWRSEMLLEVAVRDQAFLATYGHPSRN